MQARRRAGSRMNSARRHVALRRWALVLAVLANWQNNNSSLAAKQASQTQAADE